MNPKVKEVIQDKARQIVLKDDVYKGNSVDEYYATKPLEEADKQRSSMQLLCDISRLTQMHNRSFNSRVGVIDELKIRRDINGYLGDERSEVVKVLKNIEDFNFNRSTRTSQKVLDNSKSVALVVKKEDLSDYRNNPMTDRYELKSLEYEDVEVVIGTDKYNLDKDDLKFAKQRSASSLGTGFFFTKGGRYFVVTAAHVIFCPFSQYLPLRDIRFVSNYLVRDFVYQDLDAETYDNAITFPKNCVFKPKWDILQKGNEYNLSSDAEDYAIIEIEPESENEIDLLKLTCQNEENIISDDYDFQKIEEGYGLGHGLGLPLKLSLCEKISQENKDRLSNPNEASFYVQLDFFSGNSGSPIFDSTTHKLIGMLVRGQKDFHIKDKKTVVPATPSIKNEGEQCQKIYFLNRFKPKRKRNGKPLKQKELLPYSYLEWNQESNKFHLEICIANAKRKVIFSEYPKKEGDVTIIECFLEEKDAGEKIAVHRKKYIINGPEAAKSIDDLDRTSETIEIRVIDLVSKVYHESVLDFINHKKYGKIKEKDKMYWVLCLREAFFRKGSNVISLGLGYFNKAKFKQSKITDFEFDEFKWEQSSESVSIGIEEKTEKLVILTKTNKKAVIKDKVLTITELAEEGHIKKPRNRGAMSPKPRNRGAMSPN